MRKVLALLILFSVFSALSVCAEDEAALSDKEIFSIAQRCAFSFEAKRGSSTWYQNAILMEVKGKDATFVSSLRPILAGYESPYVFLNSEAGKKSKTPVMDFEHNLCYLNIKLTSKFTNMGSRKLELATIAPAVGDVVYVVRSIGRGDLPAQVLKTRLAREIKDESRGSLFGLKLDIPESEFSNLLGSPVLDKYGKMVGIMNVDIDTELFAREKAYTSDLFMHPAKNIIDGEGKKDKFPQATGLQTLFMRNNKSGLWLPVRLGPLTNAWREHLELSGEVEGFIVSQVYSAGTGLGLKISDVITHIEGSPMSMLVAMVRGNSSNWATASYITGLFTQTRKAIINLTVIRNGISQDVSVTLPRLPAGGSGSYSCQKLDTVFINLDENTHIFNDMPSNFTGVIGVGTCSGKYSLAAVKGILRSVVTQVNGEKVNNIAELQRIMDNLSAGSKARLLVLDLSDFLYKYITIVIE